MITDKDIEKLKQTFVTKEDLKRELQHYATKKDIEILRDSLVQEIANIVTILADKFDETMTEIRAIKISIDDHEQRIHDLEYFSKHN